MLSSAKGAALRLYADSVLAVPAVHAVHAEAPLTIHAIERAVPAMPALRHIHQSATYGKVT